MNLAPAAVAAPPPPESPPFWEVEVRVTELICQQSGLPRSAVRPNDRLVEDLGIDSLDLVELVIALEEAFDVSLDDERQREFFTGRPDGAAVTVPATAELVHACWGTGANPMTGLGSGGWCWRRNRRGSEVKASDATASLPFTQSGALDATAQTGPNCRLPYVPLGNNREGFAQWRRASDGMRCVLLPAAPAAGMPGDLLMDAEPVSAGAFARFLNAAAAGGASAADVARWCGAPGPHRARHFPLTRDRRGRWVASSEAVSRRPMVLVSWFGAAAYALWAQGADWRREGADPSEAAGEFLPSEAEWEHAARGGTQDGRLFPWGDEPPGSGDPDGDNGSRRELARVGCHRPGTAYADAGALPAAEVHARLGMSAFGLHHMAGNVCQWCRGWYGPGVRPERGGSWVGAAALAACGYRRGRPPAARGRCLGFRCAALAALALEDAAQQGARHP